jgi:hypothetical protein
MNRLWLDVWPEFESKGNRPLCDSTRLPVATIYLQCRLACKIDDYELKVNIPSLISVNPSRPFKICFTPLPFRSPSGWKAKEWALSDIL